MTFILIRICNLRINRKETSDVSETVKARAIEKANCRRENDLMKFRVRRRVRK